MAAQVKDYQLLLEINKTQEETEEGSKVVAVAGHPSV